MLAQEVKNKGVSAADRAFRSFFDALVPALERALAEGGLSPRTSGDERGSYGIDMHLAPLDEHDRASGYASVDVTVTGHDAGDPETSEKSLVLWFVRFSQDSPWHLITRNGYLDWLLLGEDNPTQDMPPGLHVAVRSVFPHAMEHYDWYEQRA